MSDKKFDLGEYVEVKDRIKLFYELFGQGRLVTGEVRLTTEPDGVPRVMVQGLAYRSPDDLLPGVGWSWMVLPGTTSYTKGSELENVETSAWGRAIGSLGILIDRSIASANEVQNKQGDAPPVNDGPTEELVGDISRTGKAKKGGALQYDGEWRQDPDGWTIGFALDIGKDKGIPQVVISGPLGHALHTALGEGQEALLGQKVTVSGRLWAIRQPGRTTFHRLVVSQIATDEFVLPNEPESVPAFPDLEPAA